jgi:hypothetical protein
LEDSEMVRGLWSVRFERRYIQSLSFLDATCQGE